MIFLLRLMSRLIALISKTLGLGAGVAWSGEIAMFLDPKLLPKLIPDQSKVILIAGTNGKTTTAKMVQTTLSKSFNVIHNDTGANLLNGLVGTILVNSSPSPKEKTAFVFEIDESNLPFVLQAVTPDILVLLNLFRDQLDRYGEVDTIAKKWIESFQNEDLAKTTVVINGDDPTLAFLGEKMQKKVPKVQYFGINDKSLFLPEEEHAVDSIHCPSCGGRLEFVGVYLSHLGDYHCPKCHFSHPKLNLQASKVETSLEGLYMVYNSLAAALVSQDLGDPSEDIASGLKDFKPAFGRQEQVVKDGKKVKILLSKNPAGFNASLRTVVDSKDQGPILLVLNDRIPDGRDVSWIWDVDFEILNNSNRLFLSGDRAYDLALRLKYADNQKTHLNQNPVESIKEALNETKEEETLWILATYTAMLDVRKILTGKKIL